MQENKRETQLSGFERKKGGEEGESWEMKKDVRNFN
jgi:hypothetical protein